MSEFNELTRLKSAKNRFQLSAGLNLEKLNTIYSGINIDKKINIDSLCTQNHQELYSPRTHTSKGQSVLQ